MTLATALRCRGCGAPCDDIDICVACWDRQADQDQKEEVAASKRRYRQNHKEELAASKRRYRQDHKEEVAAA